MQRPGYLRFGGYFGQVLETRAFRSGAQEARQLALRPSQELLSAAFRSGGHTAQELEMIKQMEQVAKGTSPVIRNRVKQIIPRLPKI
jgi:hypothetical protein